MSRDVEIFKKYKKIRNKLGSDIKKSRINYYTNKFSDIMYDPQKTWRMLKNVLGKSRTVLQDAMTVSGRTVGGKALSDEFNRPFLLSGAPPIQSTGGFEDYVSCNLSNSLFLYPASPEEIVTLIRNIKEIRVGLTTLAQSQLKLCLTSLLAYCVI